MSSALSAKDISGTAPRPSLSSGTKASRRCLRAAAPKSPTGWPINITALPPDFKAISPEISAANSCWPLPEIPAMPRISPPRTDSDTSVSDTPKGSSLAKVRFESASRSSPSPCGVGCTGGGIGRPIIKVARSCAVPWRGSSRAVTRPWRRIVAVSQSSRISSSLWLMNKIAMPLARSARSVSNSSATDCGGKTEVGSSNISNAGFNSRQRMISTLWRSPTDKACTIACGSTDRPKAAPRSRIRVASSPFDPGTISAMFCTTLSVSNSEKC